MSDVLIILRFGNYDVSDIAGHVPTKANEPKTKNIMQHINLTEASPLD